MSVGWVCVYVIYPVMIVNLEADEREERKKKHSYMRKRVNRKRKVRKLKRRIKKGYEKQGDVKPKRKRKPRRKTSVQMLKREKTL